jgi:predicted SAM-dependent methyltransferase
LTSRGVRRALNALWEELKLVPRHRAAVRKARRHNHHGEIKLQLGSGSQPKQGWINIDLFAPTADLALDVREDLPFPDNSVTLIYSEHLFEHLLYPTDARHVLREALRILRPGATISLVVPDCGNALLAYARRDESFFTEHDHLRSYLREEHPTLMHHVNYCFRQDELHRYGYDAETLGQVMRDAGFRDVRERAFDPQLDSEKRRVAHSLYMEGRKPAVTGSRMEDRSPETPAPPRSTPATPHA